jgi:cation:H+ antiporter
MDVFARVSGASPVPFPVPSDPLVVLATFAGAAVVVLFAGIRLTSVADRLADRTGLGEAFVGAVLLGAATSLSGMTTSVVAAWNGLPELAVSNAAGGIAAQTVFLAVADIAYRRANLEHAAASLENMLQGAVLAGCLALTLLATAIPDVSLLGVHPVSVLLVGFYLLGLRVTRRTREEPGWRAAATPETAVDDPEEDASGSASTRRLIGEFVALAGATAVAGFAISIAAEGAIETFGWSQSLMGAFATAIVTSLPELVTTVAAVRRGALTLAVGGIIGGNAFDILFIAASDVAYRSESIFAAITARQEMILALSLFMTILLVMGLLRRERQGAFGVGFETVGLVATYAAGSVVLVTMG